MECNEFEPIPYMWCTLVTHDQEKEMGGVGGRGLFVYFPFPLTLTCGLNDMYI